MSNCLLVILVIGSCVTLGGFLSKFSKYFHRCICSCWLVAFSWAFAVLFLLLTSFTVCHAIRDCNSVEDIYVYCLKDLEIVFHFHNKFISLIQFCQMEFKWTLVTFSFFPLNAGDIFRVISTCDLFYWKKINSYEISLFIYGFCRY